MSVAKNGEITNDKNCFSGKDILFRYIKEINSSLSGKEYVPTFCSTKKLVMELLHQHGKCHMSPA